MLWERVSDRLLRLREIFKKAATTDQQRLETTLIMADVGVKFARQLAESVTNTAYPLDRLKTEMIKLIERPSVYRSSARPEITVVCGVNGSGKTTTVAKLAYYWSNQNRKVIVASADTYRDAASEQLELWARKANVDIVTSQHGQDGASVAFDTVNHALQKSYDCVIVDTAGRLHTRSDLMEELKKIKRVIGKVKPGAPERILLTIDASLGQNSIKQAQVFNAAVGVTGLVLTKMDGTAKGGAIIPIVNELNMPVEFIGLGEDIDDLVPFNPEEFVEALFE